jgi:hypothetical protein
MQANYVGGSFAILTAAAAAREPRSLANLAPRRCLSAKIPLRVPKFVTVLQPDLTFTCEIDHINVLHRYPPWPARC